MKKELISLMAGSGKNRDRGLKFYKGRVRLSIVILVQLMFVFDKAVAEYHATNIPDTTTHGCYFTMYPFAFNLQPLTLPDSLGGNRHSVSFYVNVWLDSNAALLAIYPKGINIYQKGSFEHDKRVKRFTDGDWRTDEWEYVTPEMKKWIDLWATDVWKYIIPEQKRYVDWIKLVLPKNITFWRRLIPPPRGIIYAPPVRERNYVPVTVQVE